MAMCNFYLFIYCILYLKSFYFSGYEKGIMEYSSRVHDVSRIGLFILSPTRLQNFKYPIFQIEI